MQSPNQAFAPSPMPTMAGGKGGAMPQQAQQMQQAPAQGKGGQMPTQGQPSYNTVAHQAMPTQGGKAGAPVHNNLSYGNSQGAMAGATQNPVSQGFQGASSAPYNPNQGGFSAGSAGAGHFTPARQSEMTNPGMSTFGQMGGTAGTRLV
jgi:hypothetical protein